MLVHRTGEIMPHTGLVDYIADGKCKMGSEWIPCRIGYLEYECDGKCECNPEFVFIPDGITPNGFHYERQTVKADNFIMVGI